MKGICGNYHSKILGVSQNKLGGLEAWHLDPPLPRAILQMRKLGVTRVLHKGTNVLCGRVIMDPSRSTAKIIIVT